MTFTLAGKAALVTGGTRGIGLAIARSLGSAGVNVAICGRSRAGVDGAVRELADTSTASVFGYAADISSADEVSRLFSSVVGDLHGVDILINNAGLGIFRPTAELSVEDWQRVVDTNLSGAFYCCHEALPLMRKAGGGWIVNISSLAGKNPFAGGAAYNASKFALNGFSEAMMLDHRNEGIRVTYIMPGSVDTDFSPRSAKASWKIAPEDIAEIVMGVLRMPERTLISRVEVRPARPPK